MSGKNARAGGKFTGNHTSLTPAAAVVADIADKCEYVTKISPGFIKSGLRSAGGKRRVKITEKGAGFMISVRGNISHQELHIYADDVAAAKEYLIKEIKKEGFLIKED